MNAIDLHIHSVYSDSSLSLADILTSVKEKNLHTISITDHDTFACYKYLQEYSLPCAIVKGIEISAFDETLQKPVHILGYGFGEDTPHVDALCATTLQHRLKASLWQIEQLKKHGYKITKEEVEKLAIDSTAIYKQHIMDVMMKHGYSDGIYSDVYRKLFKNNGICECSIPYVSVAEAIRAIHADHGIAVLAHPYLSKVVLQIPNYLSMGIDGIETWHSSHSKSEVEDLHQIAKRYKLIETGGSDTHGRYGNEPALGECNPYMKESDVTLCSRI